MSTSPQGWVLKKYGNRRLYDLEESRYVTLEEVTQKIRRGGDPRVQDAQTGADLTQATLAQIIIEGQGATRLLPVQLLVRLIRMEPDALADFFNKGMIIALDLYLQARSQAQSAFGMNPFSFAGYEAPRPADLFSRFVRAANPWADAFSGAPPPSSVAPQQSEAPPAREAPPPQKAPPMSPAEEQMAKMRAELDELKGALRRDAAPRKKPARKRV